MATQRDNVSGLILLDKPRGVTSNHALQDAKRLLNAKKAGHTGSLDPLATGLLPLCFGEATKLSAYLLNADKSYLATFRLGECTDTCDSDGKVILARDVNVSKEQLAEEIASQVGVQQQIPPMYSALKKDGRPLYELARKGIEIEREARRVILHEFELVNRHENEIQVKIHCSSGFYVRSLAVTLGEKLGCGAHVSELRRTRVGQLSVDDSISLMHLEDHAGPAERQAFLQPADEVLTHMDRIELTHPQAKMIFQGQSVILSGLPSRGLVRLYLETGQEFMGVGLVIQGHSIKPKRLVNPQTVGL